MILLSDHEEAKAITKSDEQRVRSARTHIRKVLGSDHLKSLLACRAPHFW